MKVVHDNNGTVSGFIDLEGDRTVEFVYDLDPADERLQRINRTADKPFTVEGEAPFRRLLRDGVIVALEGGVAGAPDDGEVPAWSASSLRQEWSEGGGGSGASGPPLQALVTLAGTPILGGGGALVTLVEGDGGAGFVNIAAGCLPFWSYAAAHDFQLVVNGPTFSAGTLAVSYAELEVVSIDGANRKAAGLDNAQALASAAMATVIEFDNANEVAGAGADLSLTGSGTNNAAVRTAAGGLFQVAFYVAFIATGLVA